MGCFLSGREVEAALAGWGYQPGGPRAIGRMEWGKEAIHTVVSQFRAEQPVLYGLEFGLNEWLADERRAVLARPGLGRPNIEYLVASPAPVADRRARTGKTTVSDKADEMAIKAVPS